MIHSIVAELGPWAWWVLGIVLLILEVLMPGVFLVWIGIAAIVTGALSLLLWEQAFWTWQVQWLVFAVLSLVAALIGRRIVSARGETSDQPHLNQRGQSLVGRTAQVVTPLFPTGNITIDGRSYEAFCQDGSAPSGATVRVIGQDTFRIIVSTKP